MRHVWLDGRYVPESGARVPLMTHAIHYGTSAFEGIRAYWNGSDLNVFRLGDHVARLERSCAYYNMRPRFGGAQVRAAIVGICRKNDIRESCYIRPFHFVGDHGISLHVTRRAPVRTAIVAFPMGRIFDARGISANTVSWRKFSDASAPVQAKMGGNYLNSIIATGEAREAGADEAVLLDSAGLVSEAPGENIFVVRRGALATPPLSSSALEGITRDTVLRLARDAGIGAGEADITRAGLASADEIFLTGTAAEITPVISLDGARVGTGRPGPVTQRMSAAYADVVAGRAPGHAGWLTAVYK